MFSQVGKNLWTTKVFFVVRLAAALVVSLVYLLLAAGIQYLFVSWFGENTFNYIIGGVLSLFLGIIFCTYFGRLVFMFVRGWHVAALAYAKKIQARNLPALDAGMRVFSKHFSSFAVVYGASLMLGKFAEQGAEKLWELLEDVPYLGSLIKLADNPLVKHIAKDLLDTGFDAVIFYIVKYTKPGLDGDLEAVPQALRKYLYSLPSVMSASFLAYVLLYILPMVLRVVIIVSAFMNQGFLGGLLLTVLLYPVFYLLKNVVFDPLETIILLSAFSKHCTEEEPEDSMFTGLVDSILESIGLDNVGGGEESESDEEVEDAPKPRKKRTQSKPQREQVEEQVAESSVELEPDVLEMPIDGIPDVDRGEPQFTPNSDSMSRLASLASLLHEDEPSEPTGGLAALVRNQPHIPGLDEVSESTGGLGGSTPIIPDDEDDGGIEELSPVSRLTSLLTGLSAEDLEAGMGDDYGGDSLGGDDIDFN